MLLQSQQILFDRHLNDQIMSLLMILLDVENYYELVKKCLKKDIQTVTGINSG